MQACHKYAPFYLVWYLGCKFVMDDHRDHDDDDDDGKDDYGDEGDDGDVVIIEDDDAIAIPLYTVHD